MYHTASFTSLKRADKFLKKWTLKLTILSKLFDCSPDDLIIAKLHADGFNIYSLDLT